MGKAGFASLDFAFYMEPEAGIRTPGEFSEELRSWAAKEHRALCVEEESMEPVVTVDGVRFKCRLAEPGLAAQKNRLHKFLHIPGINHALSPFLGYDWVYFYKL